jgi:DNA helicase HerA-like ATPase
MQNPGAPRNPNNYVGTLVGESTSNQFRLAVAHETLREQDIIAVDAKLHDPDGSGKAEKIRIWAKVQRIERINPLFPAEAGHELAATRTNPFDTVLSLSREMVTAVCQILGSEPVQENEEGKLDHLRYPPQPATSAYRPESADIARVVLGDLQQRQQRALNIATLSNRDEVDVKVDGHAIVTRHLAILAMTDAGKSWTARRIIEELARKNYPIVIFDPRGDYTGLGEVAGLQGRDDIKLPVLFLLEEAHNFVPGQANTYAEERSIEITKQIAQEGRKFGVGLILISQRPSRLDETTLSQCNSYIIMRMVNPADQNFVRKVVESLGEDEARMLPDLDVGEALLTGQLINFPVLVRIKKPESSGEREEEDAFEALEKAYRES